MGLPIAVVLTDREASAFKGYMPVRNTDGPAPNVLLADKGYDADFIREDMKEVRSFQSRKVRKLRWDNEGFPDAFPTRRSSCSSHRSR